VHAGQIMNMLLDLQYLCDGHGLNNNIVRYEDQKRKFTTDGEAKSISGRRDDN
jgi:hypothetical protein